MSPSIPEEMQAVQLKEFHKPYELTTVAVPKPGPNELLIQIAAASYCHTDSMVSNKQFPSKLPLIASHEGAGIIAALGSSVKDFQLGQRIMCPIVSSRCGTCSSCHGPDARKHYCPNEQHRGVTINGAFAQYQLVDACEANIIPAGVSFETAAPLACAGRTVWRAVKTAGLERGQTLVMVGSGGGLGHIGIQFAKQLGLRVIGIDAKDSGLDLSREAGADLVVDARKGKDDVVKAVQEATGGEGAHATIALSDADSASALACAVTRMHGTMVQVAQPENVSIPFQELVFRDIIIRGSLLSSKHEADEMLASVAKHGLRVQMDVVQGLDKVAELLDRVHEGKLKGKGVVVVDEELAKTARTS